MSTTLLGLTSLLREEVEQRVAAALPEAVRDKMFYIHRKRGFSTGCDCAYCELKREATRELSFMRGARHMDRWEYWSHRKYMASKYRKALALLEK